MGVGDGGVERMCTVRISKVYEADYSLCRCHQNVKTDKASLEAIKVLQNDDCIIEQIRLII